MLGKLPVYLELALALSACAGHDVRHAVLVAEDASLRAPVAGAASIWNDSPAATSFALGETCEDGRPCIRVFFGETPLPTDAAASTPWASGNCEVAVGTYRHAPLEVVVAHELGHCLGLGHTGEPCEDGRADLMAPKEMADSALCEPTVEAFRALCPDD